MSSRARSGSRPTRPLGPKRAGERGYPSRSSGVAVAIKTNLGRIRAGASGALEASTFLSPGHKYRAATVMPKRLNHGARHDTGRDQVLPQRMAQADDPFADQATARGFIDEIGGSHRNLRGSTQGIGSACARDLDKRASLPRKRLRRIGWRGWEGNTLRMQSGRSSDRGRAVDAFQPW